MKELMKELLLAAVEAVLEVTDAISSAVASAAKVAFDVACHIVADAVPRRVVYWCAIRMLRHASNEKWDEPFPDKTNELLYRWAEKPQKKKVDA